VETRYGTSLQPAAFLTVAAPSGFPLQWFWLWGIYGAISVLQI